MVLYAGPVQMLYERGFLRYIGYRDSEILRMIYFALRDENWGTCEHVITREQKDITWETFVIDYESVHRKGNEDVVRWTCKIEGSPDSSVRFTIEGEILKEIKKNRLGFCILHPLKNVVGQPVEITQADGATYSKEFPGSVAPQNPFKNIRKLKWKFESNSYELTFEGDIFETEDQRNWIDASFKTFCTPADLPIPVTLSAGTRIYQRVTFRPLEKLQPITSHDDSIIHLEKTNKRTTLPAIGLCLSTENLSMSRQCIDQMSRLNFDHMLIDVRPSTAGWISKFSQQCEVAYGLNVPLNIRFHLPQHANDYLEQLILLIQQNKLKVLSVNFLSEDSPVTLQKHINEVLKHKGSLPDISFGAGTSGDFKDLNRNRFDALGLDFVAYSANPQTHAFDDRTLIENIDGLRETGNAASLLYPGKGVHVCPITLKPRASTKADPRQKTELAALWTFGALRATSEAGVSSVTLFETAGDHGVMSTDAEPFPVFTMLENLLRFRKHEIVILKNSEPLLVDAMLFTSDSATTLMIANYTDDLQTVRYGRNDFQIPPMKVYEVNLSSA